MVMNFSDGSEIELHQGTSIQSLILSKERFETSEEAINWIKENNFRSDKIDEPESGNTFRFRQRDPGEFKEDGFEDGKFRTITITDGVQAVIGFLKETEMQEDDSHDSETHVHEFNGGITGPKIIIEGGHYHSIGDQRTSTDPDSANHTHTLPDGKRTGPPIEENIEASGHTEEEETQMNEIKFSTNISEIKLSESKKNAVWIEAMRTVSNLDHGPFGLITITKQDITQFKENFDLQIRGKELPVDYFHEDSKIAAGWIKNLDIRDKGTRLWALVEFTEKASEMIKAKEIKFFSPTFARNFKTKAGEVIKNVLVGGGLINKPALDLSPIKLSENLSCFIENNEIKEKESIKMIEMKELTEKNVTLSEQVSDLNVKLSESKGENEQLSTQNNELTTQLSDMGKEQETIKFEAAFNTLLDEGKVVPAMKDKLKEKFNSEDLVKFYADLPQIIKMGESVGHSVQDDSKSLTDIEAKVAKEMNYSDEDIRNHGRK